MAPPKKPERERKRAYGVSLTPRQHEKLAKLGGSVWLQDTIDATPLPGKAPADLTRDPALLRLCRDMTTLNANRPRRSK